MSNPNDSLPPSSEDDKVAGLRSDREIPPWALAARIMAELEDPDDPSGIDWDAWKDEMKERDLED